MIFNQARLCSGIPCRKIEVFAKNICYLNNSSVYWLLMHNATSRGYFNSTPLLESPYFTMFRKCLGLFPPLFIAGSILALQY
jgi:hypothetical protein